MEGRDLPFLHAKEIFMMMRTFCTQELILIRDPRTGKQMRTSNRLLHEAGFRFGGLWNLIYRININHEKVIKIIVFFMNESHWLSEQSDIKKVAKKKKEVHLGEIHLGLSSWVKLTVMQRSEQGQSFSVCCLILCVCTVPRATVCVPGTGADCTLLKQMRSGCSHASDMAPAPCPAAPGAPASQIGANSLHLAVLRGGQGLFQNPLSRAPFWGSS